MEQISFTLLEIQFFFRSANIMKALSSVPLKKHVPFRKWERNSSYFFLLWLYFFPLNICGGFCCCLVEGLREGNGGSLQTTWLNVTGGNQSSCGKPALVKKHCCSFWENKHLCALHLHLYFGGGRKRVQRNPVCLWFVIYMAFVVQRGLWSAVQRKMLLQSWSGVIWST